MSKVKLTKEQAEEIKKIEDVDYAINILSLNKRPDNPLAELTIAEVARALYVGYEVEPEYPKEGDWVKYDTGSAIIYGQIDTTAFDDVIGDFSNGQRQRFRKSSVSFMTPSEIAEEKERRFFARHGRKPWELKIFDILHDGQHPYVITRIDHEYSRIELDGSGNLDLDGIEKRFKVACFVENRLDVKVDG